VTNKRVKIVWGEVVDLTIDDNGFGVLNDGALDAFTHGQCHALALVIHQLTGWIIKGASWDKGNDDSPNHCVAYWRERRAYVDIAGAQKRVKIGRDKLHISHRRLSAIQVQRLRNYVKADLDAALPFAKTILRNLNVEFSTR
jgi:hypothetical protein